MADMYGTVLSNDFRVRNVEAFTKWIQQYAFGDSQLTVYKIGDDEVRLAADAMYPSVTPFSPDDEVYLDLTYFAAELAKHLTENAICHIIAGGNEKHRYLNFERLIVNQAYPSDFHYTGISTDESDDQLLRTLAP